MIRAQPVALAPEGGAHQSVGTPLIGMAQDGLAAFEPSYADELARARKTLELHRGIAAHLRDQYGIEGEETIELDPALREQLRALGYMH